MYSIGIDAAKGKSTVCILRETEECVLTPRDFRHTYDNILSLVNSPFKDSKPGTIKPMYINAYPIYGHDI